MGPMIIFSSCPTVIKAELGSIAWYRQYEARVFRMTALGGVIPEG
jgi:hypothetical protein